jgi:hypothetical protein
MPLFGIEKLENASLWIRIGKGDIPAEYIPLLGLSAKNGSRFYK